MRKYDFATVDVFTTSRFGGNPLAVFIDDLAHTLTRYADVLMALTVRLDHYVPDWREWQLGA